MPGPNCAFPGCHVTRTKKCKGISIFQIPTRKDEFYSEWRKSILNVLTKYRSFKQTDLDERVSKGDIYICERHYVEDDFEFTSKLTYIIIYSNEVGQKLHEYRHVQGCYVYLTNLKCDI